MATTYAAFKEDVFGAIFPDGRQANLVRSHDKMFLEAMFDLEASVHCYQVKHRSRFKFCSTYFNCGATVINAPRGRIQRVYTVKAGDACCEVEYQGMDYQPFLTWLHGQQRFTSPANTGLPTLPPGFKFSETSTNKIGGRARYGMYAIHNKRLYVGPRIESDEIVVVEWDGIRRSWADEDLIPDDGPDYRRAVMLWIQKEHALIYMGDRQAARDFTELYNEARADLMTECNRENMARLSGVSSSLASTDCKPCEATVVSEEAELVFANIGDYGDPTNGTAEFDVSELVKSWEPQFIVTNGDNIYAPTDNYQDAVGDFYGDFITDDLTTNKFWPALANHDYNDPVNGWDDYFDFFTLPGNEHYYDIVKGPVHIFVYNSDDHEPDGIAAGSTQAQWLQITMQPSPAKWKIVILQDAPYTSGTGQGGGKASVRLPFKAWGADLVISGDSHSYERLAVGGLPYLVNGAGGRALDTFAATVAGSVIRYNAKNGAGRITCTCTRLLWEFFSKDGELIDSLELTKP